MVKFEPLVYNNVYKYPEWGTAIGWVLALSSMLLIPLYAIYSFIVTPGTFVEASVILLQVIILLLEFL